MFYLSFLCNFETYLYDRNISKPPITNISTKNSNKIFPQFMNKCEVRVNQNNWDI